MYSAGHCFYGWRLIRRRNRVTQRWEANVCPFFSEVWLPLRKAGAPKYEGPHIVIDTAAAPSPVRFQQFSLASLIKLRQPARAVDVSSASVCRLRGPPCARDALPSGNTTRRDGRHARVRKQPSCLLLSTLWPSLRRSGAIAHPQGS